MIPTGELPATFLVKLVVLATGSAAAVVQAVHQVLVGAAVIEWVPLGLGGVAFLSVIAARLLSEWRADRTYEGILQAMRDRAEVAENRVAVLEHTNSQLRGIAYARGWDGQGVIPLPRSEWPHPPKPIGDPPV